MRGGPGGGWRHTVQGQTGGEVEEDDRNCIPSRISINYPATLAFAIYLSIRAHRTRNESKNQNKYADTLVLCGILLDWTEVEVHILGVWCRKYRMNVVIIDSGGGLHVAVFLIHTHTHMCPDIHTHPAHCTVQG